MKILKALLLVMFGGVVFCKIIRPVSRSAFPVDDKLSLADAIPYPVKTHVHSFGVFLLDTIVCDPGGSGIIGDNGPRGLLVAQFLESNSLGDGFLAVVKQAAKFSFSGAR
jgi:hypothetical protein